MSGSVDFHGWIKLAGQVREFHQKKMATRAVGDVGSASEMSNIYSDASGGKGFNIDSESDTEVTIFGFSDEETELSIKKYCFIINLIFFSFFFFSYSQ